MQHRNRSLSLFIVGIVVAVLFTRGSLAQEKSDWKDRFFAEAPRRWEDYIHFARSLQITLTATEMVNVYDDSDRLLRSRKTRSTLVQYKQSQGAFLYIAHREVTPVTGKNQKRGPISEATVEGINSSYSFKLKRPGSDRGWIITDLQLPDQASTLRDQQRKLQEKHLQAICFCLLLENIWLPTLIQDPDFKITAIKPQEMDGVSVVRFDFDYPKPDKDYPNQGTLPIKGGWMVLDPEHDWILREYVVHTGQPEERYFRQTFQIREGANRHPLITHYTYQRVGKGGQVFGSIEAEWKTQEKLDVPLEDFTLSSFGLPEPPGIKVEKSRWYLWLALGGISCLCVGALMRWRYRRTV